MTNEELGKGPVDETMRQRVHAIAQETYRRRLEQTHPGHPIDAPTVMMAIEIALSDWTPPKPVVDPDVLAFREWLTTSPLTPRPSGDPNRYDDILCETYCAGARMAREREQERAALLARCMRQKAARLRELSTINDFDETVADGGITAGMVCRQEIAQIAQSLNDALAKYNGEA